MITIQCQVHRDFLTALYKLRPNSINTVIQTVESATKGHNYLNATRKESVAEGRHALRTSGIRDLITQNISQQYVSLWREKAEG